MREAIRAFALLMTLTTLVSAEASLAADRSVNPGRNTRATSTDIWDGLYIAARPELFQGKAVRIYCDRLRNPDTRAIVCWSNSVSIVVDTTFISGDTLRTAFENCRGMMSNCSGTVSGIVQFVRGVPYVAQADIDLLTE